MTPDKDNLEREAYLAAPPLRRLFSIKELLSVLKEGYRGCRIPSGCAISGIFSKSGERISGEKIIMAEIMPIIETYCDHFGAEKAEIMSKGFYVLTPNTKNPYKQLYCAN